MLRSRHSSGSALPLYLLPGGTHLLLAHPDMLETVIADPGCLSRIRIFSIPDPNFSIPDPVPKFFPSRIPDPNFFYPGSQFFHRIRIFSIPDPNQ
jgi:hypothetical protein